MKGTASILTNLNRNMGYNIQTTMRGPVAEASHKYRSTSLANAISAVLRESSFAARRSLELPLAFTESHRVCAP